MIHLELHTLDLIVYIIINANRDWVEKSDVYCLQKLKKCKLCIKLFQYWINYNFIIISEA